MGHVRDAVVKWVVSLRSRVVVFRFSVPVTSIRGTKILVNKINMAVSLFIKTVESV